MGIGEGYMDVLNNIACFLAIIIWLVIGVLVLASKKEPTKKDYAMCWILLITQLILNFAKG